MDHHVTDPSLHRERERERENKTVFSTLLKQFFTMVPCPVIMVILRLVVGRERKIAVWNQQLSLFTTLIKYDIFCLLNRVDIK